MAKYILELTEEQAKIASKACEFYARIRCGQFGEIPFHCMMEQLKTDDYPERRSIADNLLLRARQQIYPELTGNMGHHYGMGEFQDADTAYDIHQALRQQLGQSEKGCWQPFSYNALPVCKRSEENERKPIKALHPGDICLYTFDNDNASCSVVRIERILDNEKGGAEIKVLRVICDDSGNGLFKYLKASGYGAVPKKQRKTSDHSQTNGRQQERKSRL